ncbi:MAG TPA: T3SS effector HopA1 family protein [Longimicrobium sp.]|jgi:hypothetical protein
MSAPLLDELRRIVAAVDALGPTGFRFGGRSFQAPPQPPGAPPRAAGAPPPVVELLQNTFYQYCYVRRFAGAALDPPYAPRPDDDLVPLLSRANPTRERWEQGWEIAQILASGQVIARLHGRTRFLWPGEFLSRDGPGMQPRPGMRVSVHAPRESATMQPGFYFAFGESPFDQGDELDLVRLYWHVDDAGAPALLRHLAGALNRYGVPFRFKTLSLRSAYVRADPAVLYVSHRYFRITAELALEGVIPRVAAHLSPETPLFTRALAPGLALAEDPDTGESFGMARCRVLAEGVWQAHTAGLRTPEERMRAVAAHFAAAGVDLERPWLNPGSIDRYDPARAPAAA